MPCLMHAHESVDCCAQEVLSINAVLLQIRANRAFTRVKHKGGTYRRELPRELGVLNVMDDVMREMPRHLCARSCTNKCEWSYCQHKRVYT
eukprot:scaffold15136_cov31-Tisochrysis_lutea.AAC.1